MPGAFGRGFLKLSKNLPFPFVFGFFGCFGGGFLTSSLTSFIIGTEVDSRSSRKELFSSVLI